MPELPDVEINRQYLTATSLHQPIRDVHLGEGKSGKVLEDVTPQQLGRKLKGQAFTDARRHGKYCLVQLSGTGYLVLHFGMTGYLQYYKKPTEAPDHIRVGFGFENGYRLAFVNQRLLGRVTLISDQQQFVRQKQLGPDALDGLGADEFKTLIRRSRAQIKSLLMNQQKMAGIGNVYADEILFQARIHPAASANQLSSSERSKLYESIQQVLETAIEARADVGSMPDAYLLPVRKAGNACPRCGTELKKIKIQGRGTFFCPACQKD